MTAIISCNYEDKYLWCLPLVVWGWNRIGVDVVCFMPQMFRNGTQVNRCGDKLDIINYFIEEQELRIKLYDFECTEHKEATYTQCSRLYGACLDLPENEYLISSDVDMFVFKKPIDDIVWDKFQILGSDLVPKGQYPVCYCGATVGVWRDVFNLKSKTYQQSLDNLLGGIECENMKGNYWGKDQEELFYKISKHKRFEIKRAREGTQFSSHRYDRDDAFILDRLSLDTIDYHLNRPGYEDQNFDIILRIMKWHFPHEDFTWLINYNEQYKKLL